MVITLYSIPHPELCVIYVCVTVLCGLQYSYTIENTNTDFFSLTILVLAVERIVIYGLFGGDPNMHILMYST